MQAHGNWTRDAARAYFASPDAEGTQDKLPKKRDATKLNKDAGGESEFFSRLAQAYRVQVGMKAADIPVDSDPKGNLQEMKPVAPKFLKRLPKHAKSARIARSGA